MSKHSSQRIDGLPSLGVGITYSPAIETLVTGHPDEFHVVEIEPQTIWVECQEEPSRYRIPGQMLRHLARLPGRKTVHSLGVPVGGAVPPEVHQLELLQDTIERLGAPWITEHLSFNSTGEFSTGFFLPPRQTMEGVATAARNIRALQSTLSVPVGVETGVNYLQPRNDEMRDGEFVAAVIETADCGLLLDLHNIYCNALNGRQSMEAYLADLPLDRAWEVHLAGGFEMDHFWLDAHSGAIPDALFNMAREVIPALPNLKAIIFEIFPSFVPRFGLDAIRREIERVHGLWTIRREGGPKAAVRHSPPNRPLYLSSGPTPKEWGVALGRLVIGQTAMGSTPPSGFRDDLQLETESEPQGNSSDAIGRNLQEQALEDLKADPGVKIIRRLIQEFRASMVVGVLRLTSRLLMLALTPDLFRLILEDFWCKSPPRQFASSEASEFVNYLEALDLKVPQLATVLKFERAALATLKDGQTRVVTFDWDPLPLLRALADGRLPDMPSMPGQFEIEITPDSVGASTEPETPDAVSWAAQSGGAR